VAAMIELEEPRSEHVYDEYRDRGLHPMRTTLGRTRALLRTVFTRSGEGPRRPRRRRHSRRFPTGVGAPFPLGTMAGPPPLNR